MDQTVTIRRSTRSLQQVAAAVRFIAETETTAVQAVQVRAVVAALEREQPIKDLQAEWVAVVAQSMAAAVAAAVLVRLVQPGFLQTFLEMVAVVSMFQ
jgi:protein gp37